MSARLLLWLGLNREVGEPARKALIVDLSRPDLRARAIGLYYLVRSLSITPAAFLGGVLWRSRPALPFLLAGAFGLAGALAFGLMGSESRYFPKPAEAAGRTE